MTSGGGSFSSSLLLVGIVSVLTEERRHQTQCKRQRVSRDLEMKWGERHIIWIDTIQQTITSLQTDLEVDLSLLLPFLIYRIVPLCNL